MKTTDHTSVLDDANGFACASALFWSPTLMMVRYSPGSLLRCEGALRIGCFFSPDEPCGKHFPT